MTEETSQKKVVGRTIAIVLGMICIVLSASLVAVLALYLPSANSNSQLKSEIAEKNDMINSQNTTIVSQSQQIVALQSSLQQATSGNVEEIAYLEDYVSELLNVVYMNASSYLLLNQGVALVANESVTVWSDYMTYAGYVTVQVQSSSNTTYAQVVYSTYGVDYDETKVVGTGGAVSFPVLPASIVEVKLGNTEASSSVEATVTAVYVY
jgi:hypothetical protein